jgi:hypothetical protein
MPNFEERSRSPKAKADNVNHTTRLVDHGPYRIADQWPAVGLASHKPDGSPPERSGTNCDV